VQIKAFAVERTRHIAEMWDGCTVLMWLFPTRLFATSYCRIRVVWWTSHNVYAIFN